jgi:hypothetical protein
VLADQVDAVGDLLVAEGVFQSARGAYDRPAATIDSVARGETVSLPEVLDTPRTGIGLTHRLIALFGTLTAAPSGFVPQPRAAAEPFLNAWVGQLLGSPVRVRFRATYLDPVTGAPLPMRNPTREIRLSDIRMSPLDLLYMADGRSENELGELEQRLRYFAKRVPLAGAPLDAEVRLDYTRIGTWGLNQFLSMDELLEQLRAVRALVRKVRAMGAEDLALPEGAAPPAIEVAELRRRATNAETALRLVRTDLRALLDAPDTADLEALRVVLVRASHFGIYSAIPLSALGATPADRAILLEQAAGVDLDLLQRIGGLERLPAAGTDAASQVERELDRLRLIFGRDFLALPRFKVANGDVLAQAFGMSANLQGGDTTQVTTWLARTAPVREGTGRLMDALRYAEAVESLAPSFTVAQLPAVAGERWVALPPAPGTQLPPGRISLVQCGPLPTDLRGVLCGLVVDEWNDVVPNARESTGLVFHYDEPDARAPQAILLAVAPDVSQPWNLDTLEAVLLDTLELASLRLVDPDAMTELDHFLPALYFGVNAANDAVSTRFVR